MELVLKKAIRKKYLSFLNDCTTTTNTKELALAYRIAKKLLNCMAVKFGLTLLLIMAALLISPF